MGRYTELAQAATAAVPAFLWRNALRTRIARPHARIMNKKE